MPYDKTPIVAEIMEILESFPPYKQSQIFTSYKIENGNVTELCKPELEKLHLELLERRAGMKAWSEHDPQPATPPTIPKPQQYIPNNNVSANEIGRKSFTHVPPHMVGTQQNHSPQGTASEHSQSDRNVTNMAVDYEKMQKDIDNRGKFWKVPEGDTVIIPKSELGEPFEDKFKDKIVTKSNLTVDAAGIEKTWSLTVGGKDSVYAKLVAIGMKHKTLIGIPIRVTRQGKDKDNTVYVIVDMSK